MAELNWTREAEQWLRDIYDFIAQDSPGAAIKTVQSLYDKVQDLRQFPQLGYR